MTRGQTLLDDIEAGALDSTTSIADVLRKCVALGGATGSDQLRDWASHELRGYDTADDLPNYRRVNPPLLMDGQTTTHLVTGAMVDLSLIPDVAHDTLDPPVDVRQPISEISNLIDRSSDGIVRFAPPGERPLVALMNSKLAQDDARRMPGLRLPPSRRIERVYWGVPLSSLESIIDNVRTTLVELVAEMRAASPTGANAPTHDAAEQAVAVVLTGSRNRVVVNQAAQGSVATGADHGAVGVGSALPERRSRRVAWWVVAAATIVGAGASVMLYFHH